MDPIHIIWLTMIIISVTAEAITLQLVSLWFVFGALSAFITSLFTPSLYIQIIVFIVVSISMLLLARPILKNLLRFKIEETNYKSLIGKTAKVTNDIDNSVGKGEVNIEGNIWSARSISGEIIHTNELVVIDDIAGVKLIVHKI